MTKTDNKNDSSNVKKKMFVLYVSMDRYVYIKNRYTHACVCVCVCVKLALFINSPQY